MNTEIKEYTAFLKKFIILQGQLIQEFEKHIKTVEIFYEFPEQLKADINILIGSHQNISDILHFWSPEISRIPLHIWITPKKGGFRIGEQLWHFDIHGFAQISFIARSSEVSKEAKIIKIDENNLVPGLPSSNNVEVTYLEGGRYDGISTWSVFRFAHANGSKFGSLSQVEHEVFLENLVAENVLQQWPTWGSETGKHYVFLPNS